MMCMCCACQGGLCPPLHINPGQAYDNGQTVPCSPHVEGGCTDQGWVEKKDWFGLKMGSTSGCTRRRVLTSEQKSQPWSPHVVETLTLISSTGRGGTVQEVLPTLVSS